MADAPKIEIQLGHLCNNRCLFCVSGRLTHERKAPLLSADEIKQRIREAHEAGHRNLTLLGGEPTVQPNFIEIVDYAVALGFDEIVIFSNGTRLHRPALLDRILQTGGRFEWRFSFQGATREAHERTTRRRGSFDQLVRSVASVAERGEKITVNMCVVRQNFESVEHFPTLLLPHGVVQLHLDMLHPDDMPDMTRDELREIMPRFSDLVGPLDRMFDGFPDDFDVHVGSFPYCLAPHRAERIHHSGQATLTTTVDVEGLGRLNEAWDKYERKQTNKVKPERCSTCVFDSRCTGVFAAYADLYGTDELQPVTLARLAKLAPQRSLGPPGDDWFAEASPRIDTVIARLRAQAPFGALEWRDGCVRDGGRRMELTFKLPSGEETLVWFVDTGTECRSGYQVDEATLRARPDLLVDGLREVFAAVSRPDAAITRSSGRADEALPGGASPFRSA